MAVSSTTQTLKIHIAAAKHAKTAVWSNKTNEGFDWQFQMPLPSSIGWRWVHEVWLNKVLIGLEPYDVVYRAPSAVAFKRPWFYVFGHTWLRCYKLLVSIWIFSLFPKFSSILLIPAGIPWRCVIITRLDHHCSICYYFRRYEGPVWYNGC